ncbi:hypothetical protein [Reinekea sp.]|uniref:hypothetical protein n=1 Tax=Reinekea sp. TaxID=1970455 RepID=UPI002A7FDD8C|nr:hypothetical protein [Reinekea sp.]
MMKRLYYLINQIEYAEHISAELIVNGIDANHIHVLSKDSNGMATRQLNGLNMCERFDFIRGALNGFLIGLLIFLTALLIGHFTLGYDYSGSAQFISVVVLLLLGTCTGAVIGFSNENIHLRRFQGAINEGRHLVMIDVGAHQERTVHTLVALLSKAQYSGEDDQVII